MQLVVQYSMSWQRRIARTNLLAGVHFNEAFRVTVTALEALALLRTTTDHAGDECGRDHSLSRGSGYNPEEFCQKVNFERFCFEEFDATLHRFGCALVTCTVMSDMLMPRLAVQFCTDVK
jgi:hypothetical protein